jgi:FKBP-type peptidyl-prolyl cis-trans isomerase
VSRATRIATTVLLTAALVTACGEDEGDDVATAPPSPPAAQPGVSPTPCADVPAVQEARPETTADLSAKPSVEGTDAEPPCALVVRDVVVGEGAEVVPGAFVQVRYVGAFYESGEEFDSSWRISPENTLPFQAGGGNLIPGFDTGVLGMREGGRREVVIPSDLGYGPTGSGPIPPAATLVFVIDAVSVEGP